MELEFASAAAKPPLPSSVLKATPSHSTSSAAAAAAAADPAVLPLHNALPRLAIMAHQVRALVFFFMAQP